MVRTPSDFVQEARGAWCLGRRHHSSRGQGSRKPRGCWGAAALRVGQARMDVRVQGSCFHFILEREGWEAIGRCVWRGCYFLLLFCVFETES
jgi:hypothetical protein